MRLRALLVESLALWQLEGSVELAEPPCVAVIRTHGGCIVWVERAPQGSPFRWFARWRNAGFGAAESRTRPCGSLVGLLNAIRMALDVERGSPVRIA